MHKKIIQTGVIVQARRVRSVHVILSNPSMLILSSAREKERKAAPASTAGSSSAIKLSPLTMEESQLVWCRAGDFRFSRVP